MGNTYFPWVIMINQRNPRAYTLTFVRFLFLNKNITKNYVQWLDSKNYPNMYLNSILLFAH